MATSQKGKLLLCALWRFNACSNKLTIITSRVILQRRQNVSLMRWLLKIFRMVC